MFTIVCLIGSTKFESTFRKLEEELSLAGYLVFSPLVYTQSGEPPLCGVQNKKVLDEVQKAKINYSHIVLVVDEKGYIGSSTKDQIRHAEFLIPVLTRVGTFSSLKGRITVSSAASISYPAEKAVLLFGR